MQCKQAISDEEKMERDAAKGNMECADVSAERGCSKNKKDERRE